MAKVSPLMVLPPVIFGALGVLFYLGLGREGKDDLESMFEGKPAPAVTKLARANDTTTTTDLRIFPPPLSHSVIPALALPSAQQMGEDPPVGIAQRI